MTMWDKIKRGFRAGKNEEPKQPNGPTNNGQTIDPTKDPIDNPMDFREDGSIRPGDPMWDIMQRVMNGESAMGRQRKDGTWDVEFRKID